HRSRLGRHGGPQGRIDERLITLAFALRTSPEFGQDIVIQQNRDPRLAPGTLRLELGKMGYVLGALGTGEVIFLPHTKRTSLALGTLILTDQRERIEKAPLCFFEKHSVLPEIGRRLLRVEFDLHASSYIFYLHATTRTRLRLNFNTARGAAGFPQSFVESVAGSVRSE